MTVKVTNDIGALLERMKGCSSVAWAKNYYAFYSSVFGAIVTDPALMLVPVADHLVQRGDGVFETLKCLDGAVYNLQGHWDRLQHSARGMALHLPVNLAELKELLRATIHAGQHRTCSLRIILARGPGGLSVDPYECPETALYLIVGVQKDPFMKLHPQGARVRSSIISAKPKPFAAIKTCNYLPNMLMKKEAVDNHVDFTLAFDAQGNMAEGAAENMAIVTSDGSLVFPPAGGVLEGTTQLRVMALAQGLVADGTLTKVERRLINRDEIRRAKELLVVGTTPDVAAAVEFDGKIVGDGCPGEVYQKLSALLLADIATNEELRWLVY